MVGYIYKITNRLNGKSYVGQTIQDVKTRWYRHCGKKCAPAEMNMEIKKAILKYGKDNFELDILEECDSELLNIRERFYISYYDSYNNGYNKTLGGQDGMKPLQTSKEVQQSIIDLYKYGFSLRTIAEEFKIDKATVKGVLLKYNMTLRDTKTYKFCKEMRQDIVDAVNNGTSRKEIMSKYNISKSYLSQLLSGQRRI